MEESYKNILNDVVNFLNSKFNQDSDEYNIFNGAKPQVLKYGDHTAISIWACGAIICIYDQLYFVSEDDGYWWINNGLMLDNKYADGDKLVYKNHNTICGYQESFSIGWIESFCNALNSLNEYVKNNGQPVYFSGLTEKIICHYTL